MNRRQFLTFGMPKPATAARSAPVPFNLSSKLVRNSNLDAQQLASRFLAQATLGHTMAEIDELVSIGFETWINNQFSLPINYTLDMSTNTIAPLFTVVGEDGVDEFENQAFFRYAWWQSLMTNPDQLRQKVAYALSQIMVISTKPDELEDLGTATSTYHDIMLKHAFGNFRDLLYDVTMNPAMGFYLSHAGNQKSDPSINRYPDENYAREIMQLFSIGLFELNNDGTRKKDSSGNDIPTYDNSVIREFAKIFTGLTYGEPPWYAEEEIVSGSDDAFLIAELLPSTCRIPMIMYDQFHEPGAKTLLNGQVLPGGQTGLKDLNDAIDNIFNHPNVAPFIGRLLIQRFVTSNPSPAYVNRVANAFNNNGSGVRGDMKAVIRAILMDTEARDPSMIADMNHGMLREPFTRYTQLCRALEARNEEGENLFLNSGYDAEENLGQYPYTSPSVFNFYMPDYRPLGPLLDADLNGPEFQIMTSVTATKYFNFFERAILEDLLMDIPDYEEDESLDEENRLVPPRVTNVGLNLDPYWDMEGNLDGVLDRFDLLLTYGTLSDSMRALIRQSMSDLQDQIEDWDQTVRFGLLLLMNSPEFAILK